MGSRYNASAAVGTKIELGDYVVDVNGVRGDALEMIRICKEEQDLRLTIRRPEIWTVTIKKDSQREGLGVKLGWQGESRSLVVIDSAKTGALPLWNKAHPETQVRLSDR